MPFFFFFFFFCSILWASCSLLATPPPTSSFCLLIFSLPLLFNVLVVPSIFCCCFLFLDFHSRFLILSSLLLSYNIGGSYSGPSCSFFLTLTFCLTLTLLHSPSPSSLLVYNKDSAARKEGKREMMATTLFFDFLKEINTRIDSNVSWREGSKKKKKEDEKREVKEEWEE